MPKRDAWRKTHCMAAQQSFSGVEIGARALVLPRICSRAEGSSLDSFRSRTPMKRSDGHAWRSRAFFGGVCSNQKSPRAALRHSCVLLMLRASAFFLSLPFRSWQRFGAERSQERKHFCCRTCVIFPRTRGRGIRSFVTRGSRTRRTILESPHILRNHRDPGRDRGGNPSDIAACGMGSELMRLLRSPLLCTSAPVRHATRRVGSQPGSDFPRLTVRGRGP